MNRLRMSVDGAFAQEIVLTRQETTIGRKPHNDIVTAPAQLRVFRRVMRRLLDDIKTDVALSLNDLVEDVEDGAGLRAKEAEGEARASL